MKIFRFVLFFFALILILPQVQGSVTDGISLTNLVDIDQSYDFDYDNFTKAMELTTLNQAEVTDGKTIFTVRRFNYNANVPGRFYDQYFTIVVDFEGNIEKSFRTNREGVYFVDPEMINSTTAVMTNDTIFFWNIETGETEVFPIPAGTHDVEYNPNTETFLSKYWAFSGNYSSDGVNYYPILYNDLYEYNKQGEEVWYWNSSEHFPFNPDMYTGEIAINSHLWMSANSLFWDYENDKVILGARTLDTFYQIDKATGNVDWGLGYYGDFKMFNKHGVEVDSLFYHAHAIEKIGENRFILFDNDYQNKTKIAMGLGPREGVPRYVEIEVDMDTMEAHEVWSYAAPHEYYGDNWGDADRLPDGNTLGKFGTRGAPNWIVEVNESGEKVWELELKNGSDFEWGVYRVERFYEAPLVELASTDFAIGTGETLKVDLETWDNIKNRHDSPGTITVLEDGTSLYTSDFEFTRYWQPKALSFTIDDLSDGIHNLKVMVTNQDDRIGEVTITVSVGSTDTSSVSQSMGIVAGSIFISVILLRKRKTINQAYL